MSREEHEGWEPSGKGDVFLGCRGGALGKTERWRGSQAFGAFQGRRHGDMGGVSSDRFLCVKRWERAVQLGQTHEES